MLQREITTTSLVCIFLPGLPHSSCVCLCLCISYVCLFPPWNVRFKCLLLILSFLLVFYQSCCLFPHTQRFLRAALIFAAARGHYQLIDYFDCYLIPPLGRARRICASVVSRSLSLVHSEALSFVRCRRFANVSYLPINLRTGRRRHIWSFVLPFHTSCRRLLPSSSLPLPLRF